MQKNLITAVVLIVLGVGAFFGFQQYQVLEASKLAQAREVAAVHARQVAEAKQRAAAEAAVAKQRADAEAALAKQRADLEAARKDIDTQLKAMKVTSILLGDPALAIIDKKEYAGGDGLALAQGKTLLITAVRADGVFLAYNGLAFRLDPPGAPDLAALRRPR